MLLEILIAAVIIIALLLLIGVKLQTILLGLGVIVLVLIALAMLSIILFFFLTDLFLPFRKPVKGKFLRVDDSGRMDHAIYQVGEDEYTCSFPAESFARKRIYQTDNVYAAAERAAHVRKEVNRIVAVSQNEGGKPRRRKKKPDRTGRKKAGAQGTKGNQGNRKRR